MQAYCEPTLRSVSPGCEFPSLIHKSVLVLTYDNDLPTRVPHARGTHRGAALDDPVNLMSYVSAVFRQYFGYSAARAEELMMAVHTRGRATVSTGVRERIEADVMAMHSYGLRATIEEDRD